MLLEIVNFYLLFNADFALNTNFSDELISSLASKRGAERGRITLIPEARFFPHESGDDWRYIASNRQGLII